MIFLIDLSHDCCYNTFLIQSGPPEFINESKHIAVTPGQNVTFSSPIRSHTLAIGLCQMTKFSDDCYQSSLCLSDMCNKSYSCTESKRNEVKNETEAQTCRCALSGIVPNLNLEIFFSKMIVFEFGLWKLIFNNNVGTDLLYVCIQPYPGKESLLASCLFLIHSLSLLSTPLPLHQNPLLSVSR